MTERVLLVDDDLEVREALGQSFDLAGLKPVLARAFIEAKDHISAAFDGVIVTDIRMPGRDGFHLLDHARKIDPELPVILLTGQADVPMAVAAMDAGAHAFLEKPCAPSELLDVVRKALAARAEVLQARRMRVALESGDAASRMLFGISAQAEALRTRVRTVAKSVGEVVVTGEAGVGTPKVAEVIHLLSANARHPFVKRAGAALMPEQLSEAFAAAGSGTLFVDEVAELPLAAQYALLEWLEGAGRARVIAGTTRDLAEEATSGRFSSDLFYRLDLMRVRIPSIRERTEDIPVLFRHYVAQASEQANLTPPAITSEVTARLMAQDWPGNARALMNAAMRFAMGLNELEAETPLGLAEQMAQIERSLLIDALRRCQGHASETARQLKLPRKTFYDKLARHGLKAEDYRSSDTS